MPLVYVQRYVVPEIPILPGGTQYVDGQLQFNGATTIYLSNAVFGKTGRYVLFDYSEGTFPGGQPDLSNITVDASDLIRSHNPVLTDDPENARVLLDLSSRIDNGTQFVDGDLTIDGATTLYLSADLYASAGVYTLFDVTGTITGTSNLTCVSMKGLSAGAPYKDGNTIKVVLA